MTRSRKVLVALAVLIIAFVLLWKNSVAVIGIATPGTCKVKTATETKQLEIADAFVYVNQEISAGRNLSAESVTCTLWPSNTQSSEDLNMIGLTTAAQYMWDSVDERFGFIAYGGFGPGGVNSGHSKDSAHYKGKAIDFFFKPYKSKAQVAKGWTLANWAVVNAERLGIATVIYQDRIWSQNSSFKGWQGFTPSYGDPKNPTLRHLDHVHIDVN